MSVWALFRIILLFYQRSTYLVVYPCSVPVLVLFLLTDGSTFACCLPVCVIFLVGLGWVGFGSTLSSIVKDRFGSEPSPWFPLRNGSVPCPHEGVGILGY